MKKILKFLKNIVMKLFQAITKNLWYSLLLSISSIYVFIYRYNIDKLSEFNAINLIFLLWLILLGFPLFSEIEIGSVKLKKELEETRKEVKDSISELKLQIMDVKVSNSAKVINYNGNTPLSSKAELLKMEKLFGSNEPSPTEAQLEFGISEDNIYLFQVRLSLEKKLSALCNLFQYEERRTMYSMVQFLVQCKVINRKTADLIREIIAIANRGVHGEIVDDDYIQFVRNIYPKIIYTLEEELSFYSNNAYYFECPKCHYQGSSKYSNICPRCGFNSDDD